MSEVIGIAVISAVCGYILEQLGFGGTRLYFACVSVIMLIFCIDAIGPLLSSLMSFPRGELVTDVGGAALRVLGIGYVGGFFSDFCIGLGAKGASDGLTLFTKIQILGVVMPYFLDILRLAGGMLC